MVVTYGLAHHVMSAVLKPDVPRAIAARDIRAPVGRPESTTNRTGERQVVSAIEDNEKIFRLRNALVNGPWYTKLSSVSLHSCIELSMFGLMTPACRCVEDVEIGRDDCLAIHGVPNENRREFRVALCVIDRRLDCITRKFMVVAAK